MTRFLDLSNVCSGWQVCKIFDLDASVSFFRRQVVEKEVRKVAVRRSDVSHKISHLDFETQLLRSKFISFSFVEDS